MPKQPNPNREPGGREFDGLQNAAEMLAHLDGPTRDRILAEIELRESALAEQLRSRMQNFESLLNIAPEVLQRTLREVPLDKLALAMRTASEALATRILENMPSRTRQALQEERMRTGPRKRSEVEKAQAEILKRCPTPS